jgi:hypothetical protein
MIKNIRDKLMMMEVTHKQSYRAIAILSSTQNLYLSIGPKKITKYVAIDRQTYYDESKT